MRCPASDLVSRVAEEEAVADQLKRRRTLRVGGAASALHALPRRGGGGVAFGPVGLEGVAASIRDGGGGEEPMASGGGEAAKRSRGWRGRVGD